MKKIILVIALAFVSGVSAQNGFKLIGKTQDQGNYYVKIEDATATKTSISLKTEKVKASTDNNGKTTYTPEGYQISHLVIYCGEKLLDKLHFVVYDNNGKAIESGDKNELKKPLDASSIDETLYNYACHGAILD